MLTKMLPQGETPPGIRTDIVDVPTNPAISPTPPSAAPRRKPWQAASTVQNSNLQGALMQAASNGAPFSSPEPWFASPTAAQGANGNLAQGAPLQEVCGESHVHLCGTRGSIVAELCLARTCLP